MKHLVFVALLAVTAAVAQTGSPAGTEAAQPFKKANVVVIHTADSTATAYKKIAQAILEAGYTIDRADKELGFVNTKVKVVAKTGVHQTIQASIKNAGTGTQIELRGAFTMPTMAAISPIMAGETVSQYRGMKGSAIMSSWDEISHIASLYPNATVAYKQQP